MSTAAQDLDSTVKRLETITVRLEGLYGVNPSASLEMTIASLKKQLSDPRSLNPNSLDRVIQSLEGAMNSSENDDGRINEFDDIVNGPFKSFFDLSKKIGDVVATQSSMVEDAVKAQRAFLVTVSKSKKPSDAMLTQQLLKPTSDKIGEIQAFRETNRRSNYFNHLSSMSESIPALGWVAVAPAPSPFVKEMNDAGQFYTNRVLKDFKEKSQDHVNWVKAWITALSELQAFVKKFHTTGLVWNPKGDEIKVTPPAGGGGGILPPPPPPPGLFDDIIVQKPQEKSGRNDLLEALNRGEDATKGLKKVTADMQTHKNPSLRAGSTVKSTKTTNGVGGTKTTTAAPLKPPKFELDGKKWIVEYQKNNPNLVINGAEVSHSIYMYRCEGSTLKINGKCNNVILDSCKKSAVVYDALVSSCEFINCQSIQMQVLDKVPTISVEKTDGCQMFLSKHSTDTVIITSKSSEMNVSIPQGADGDFVEYPVAEQFKTVFNGSKLVTTETEST